MTHTSDVNISQLRFRLEDARKEGEAKFVNAKLSEDKAYFRRMYFKLIPEATKCLQELKELKGNFFTQYGGQGVKFGLNISQLEDELEVARTRARETNAEREEAVILHAWIRGFDYICSNPVEVERAKPARGKLKRKENLTSSTLAIGRE